MRAQPLEPALHAKRVEVRRKREERPIYAIRAHIVGGLDALARVTARDMRMLALQPRHSVSQCATCASASFAARHGKTVPCASRNAR